MSPFEVVSLVSTSLSSSFQIPNKLVISSCHVKAAELHQKNDFLQDAAFVLFHQANLLPPFFFPPPLALDCSAMWHERTKGCSWRSARHEGMLLHRTPGQNRVERSRNVNVDQSLGVSILCVIDFPPVGWICVQVHMNAFILVPGHHFGKTCALFFSVCGQKPHHQPPQSPHNVCRNVSMSCNNNCQLTNETFQMAPLVCHS